MITADGARWFEGFGIDLSGTQRGRRHLARQCLDWSERRHHMAGALVGALVGTLTSRLFELQWISRIPGGRAVRVTDQGFKGVEAEFGLTLGR